MTDKRKQQREEQRLAEWAAKHFYTLEEARAIRDQRRREWEETARIMREHAAWDKEHDEKRWLEEHPFAAKEALDSMRETVKVIDLLLRSGRLSPEAMGFTSRKVDNLITGLELLKAKLDGRDNHHEDQ